MSAALEPLVKQLGQRKIAVIGDLILDEYLYGNATRMSREAPVPVIEFESRKLIPGGAANPATNIVALNSHVMQIGIVGDDDSGKTLKTILAQKGIDTRGIISDPNRPTTVKMRIMAQMGLRFPQQVARLDTLSRDSISPEIEQQLQTHLATMLPDIDAVLVSDYHSGLLTTTLIESLHEIHADVRFIADAQGSLEKYARFDLVKCNADDAAAYLQREIHSDEDFAHAAKELLHALSLTHAMVITRGAEGATIATHNTPSQHCPAPMVTDVYDTVGAGDTAIAVLTLALCAGATVYDATMLANYASGLVVRRFGNYAPSPDELVWALHNWNSSRASQ